MAQPANTPLPDSHEALLQGLRAFIPAGRLIDDPLRTLAFGTDASFYRLIPRLVVKVESEQEVTGLLRLAGRHGTPVTFRAAGTSLSGQAVTDSVLAVLGEHWQGHSINADASEITLQPGVIGGHANRWLLPFKRKIGPDPASINAAKIGGIAANNASGMCCGVSQNSYHTLVGMRIILADGTLLDTRDPASRREFEQSHAGLLDQVRALAAQVRENAALSARIRHKYRLKNTTGYGLNSLLDFDDPIDIIQHLMIGSEGTLGFIAEITYRTVPDYPHKATALMLFPELDTACRAVAVLKTTPVDAVELMDRPALRSVADQPGMPAILGELGGGAAALLVETRAPDPDQLGEQTALITGALEFLDTLEPVAFTREPAEYERLWNIRKGLFPAVGAVRPTGTTVIIEDVAFPVPQLADATRDLQGLFSTFGYHEAIIFGHALEGNLHFVFTPDFGVRSEVERYRGLMDAVAELVVNKYNGSLKAEHSTGRNMAPFVAMEWGADGYALMQAIKAAFDPSGLLNPGVVLNDDPEAHLKHLKLLPAAHPIVDKCIECGFCEPVCPSRNLTLTPRQRIAGRREIARLEASGADPGRLETLRRDYQYQGLDTCAADGMCATRCPVGIDTGALTKSLRAEQWSGKSQGMANWLAGHVPQVVTATRFGLGGARLAQNLLGDGAMQWLTNGIRRLSGGRIPPWSPYLPGPAGPMPPLPDAPTDAPAVVYFPSCVSRAMGPAKGDADGRPLTATMLSLLGKAGYRVLLPERLGTLCCGMPFASKGLNAQADGKADELNRVLLDATRNGEYPVLCDTSPCTLRMRENLDPRLEVFEPVGFVQKFLRPRLRLQKQAETVAVHVTCSSRKMGLEAAFLDLAGACAERVVVPDDMECCGFAGDRGFSFPELNASALDRLDEALPGDCEGGYSNSRTCEIGLSLHSGRYYRSIASLVDRCAEPAQPQDPE